MSIWDEIFTHQIDISIPQQTYHWPVILSSKECTRTCTRAHTHTEQQLQQRQQQVLLDEGGAASRCTCGVKEKIPALNFFFFLSFCKATWTQT